jgi:hypothetical protein
MGQEDFKIPKGLSCKGQKAAEVIVAVIQKHTIDRNPDGGGCRAFYTPEEWTDREELYGQDSELVVCHDGGDAAAYFNYDYECYKMMDFMQRELERHGMYAEQCTSWYTAIYKI